MVWKKKYSLFLWQLTTLDWFIILKRKRRRFIDLRLFNGISADRRIVFANMRIRIPEKLLQFDGQTRTVQATNNYNNLKVYLYFSSPVLNSSQEILNSLTISQGTLLPTNRNNLGNRRFGFLVNWFIVSTSLICISDAYIS